MTSTSSEPSDTNQDIPMLFDNSEINDDRKTVPPAALQDEEMSPPSPQNPSSRGTDGGSSGSKLSFEEQSTKLVNQYLEATTPNSKPTGSSSPFTQNLIEQLVSVIHQEPNKNLLSVIQAAGSALTSQSDPTRASANRLLAELIAPLVESKILIKNQVHFLVQFFIQKLDDGPTIVIEAINGLKYLARSTYFQAEQVVDCCKALFKNVTMSDFEQPKRLTILMLIDNLMAYHRDTLKGMGSNFLTGYCSLVEGEKDPRNLIVGFKLAKVILTEFDLGDQAESMFDITFCYFPITFRPPPGNPDAYGGITADELIQGLIGCLSATPQFGIFVLPLLLEKFQAPGFGPKAQVLETVIQAFPTYGQATVAEFGSLFWECFLVEIFQPNTSYSKEFLGLLERACQTLFTTIFPLDANFSPSGPVGFMKQAIEVLIKELHSPEKSRAIPGTRLVCWIIESGANMTDVIQPTITTSVGTLLQLWTEITTMKEDERLKKQIAILAHLRTIFRSIATITIAQVSVAAFQSSTWLPTTIRQEILSMLLTEVTGNKQCVDSHTQVAALWTLVQFVNIPNTLDLQEARNVIDTVTQLLVAGHNDEIINAGMECLSILANSHTADVASVTIPELFEKLAALSFHTATKLPPSPAKYLHILECLATLCHRETLFNAFLVRLLDVFALCCRAAFKASMNELICEDTRSNHFDQHAYGHHLLLSLHATIKSLAESSKNHLTKPVLDDLGHPAMVQTHARFIIGRMFEILLYEDHPGDLVSIIDQENKKISAKLGQNFDQSSVCNHCSIRNDVQIVIDTGRIINLLVRQLDFEQQQELATELHAGYQLGNMDELIEKLQNKSAISSTSQTKRTKKSCNPMCIDSSDADKNMMILYSEALIAIRPGIKVPGEVLSATDFFTFRYYKYICKTNSPNLVAFQAGLRYLCSTVNRRAEDFPEFFGEQLNQFWESEINVDQSSSLQSRKLALEIWLWIVKGLIVRVDFRGYELLDRVCGLLKEQSDFVWWVAKRLSVIVDPKDETLNTNNFANIKFLWLQRVCHYLVTRLIKGYSQSTGDACAIYLVGLATSLARVGSPLISLQHEKVIPLLLEAMNLKDLDVKLDSLSTIYDFILNDQSSVTLEKNLSALVSALLLNCTFGSITVNPNNIKDFGPPKISDPSPGVSSSAIRLLALKVLSILPSKIGDGTLTSPDSQVVNQRKTLSKGVLYGERSKVLQVLKKTLDDPKREVRRMAVDCRARWFSFNSN